MLSITAVLAATAIPIKGLTSGYESASLYISLMKVPQHDGRIQGVVFFFFLLLCVLAFWTSYLSLSSPDTL